MRRIFIDYEKCLGCNNCNIACMIAHDKSMTDFYTVDLESRINESRNHILMSSEGKYMPLFCRHCDEPQCAISCISGAMKKDDKTGLVLYDETKCASCFMCVMNCPYGVLKPDRLTNKVVIKCDFCIDDGGEPNCVKSCPTNAIYVVEVDEEDE